MNDDQLDDEIRALMSAVVADAPQPKPLPDVESRPTSAAPRVGRSRALVWTGVAVAASLVLAVTLIWSSRNDNKSVTGATSSVVDQTTIASLTTTTSPGAPSGWPATVTAIVTSGRGIETVTAENGDPVVTRLSDPDGPGGSVVRAYVGIDGQLVASYCCQESATPHIWVTGEDGTGQPIDEAGGDLLDVAPDGAVLYATGGTGSRLMLWVDGQRTQLSVAPDSPGEADPEFHFLGDFVVGAWGRGRYVAFAVDRTGQPFLMDVVLGSVATATGPGMQEARLDLDGQLTVTDGSTQKIVNVDADGVVGLDVLWPYVLVSHQDAPPHLVDALTGDVRELPMADGFATFSMKATVDPTTTVDFPDGDVRAVVTQRDSDADDGVWIVTDDEFVQVDVTAGGPAYLAGDTLLFSPKAGGIVALDRTTGATQTLRTTGNVVDAAVLGGQLYYLYSVSPVDKTTYLYLHGPNGDTFITTDFAYTDLGHLTWHLGRDVIVGTGAYYSSLRPEFYDFAGNYLEDLSNEFAPATQPPDGNRMLYTMNPEGLWGIVDGDVLTLRQWGDATVLDTITIPDGAQALDLDISADRIVVSYNLGTNGADAGREAVRDQGIWTWSDLPGSGWATMPRTTDPGAPAAVTPLTEPPYLPSVALAGDFGVKLVVGDGTEKIMTTDPADQVLLHRNGAISFRSPGFGAYSQRWDPVTGEKRSYWAGTNWFAEPNLHDDLGLTGDFLFSVLDHVKRFSDERSWPTPGAQNTRLSCSYDGWLIGNGVRFAMGDSEPPEWLGTAGGEWALTPDGALAASTTDGLIRVRRTRDGAVIYEQSIGDRLITEIDVSGEWLAYIETPDDTPAADSTSRAVLVHLPSGRSLTYEGAVSVSLANNDI